MKVHYDPSPPNCGIYVLRDPKTNRIMYVGQSVDMEKREFQHVNRSEQMKHYHYHIMNKENVPFYLIWELQIKTPPIFEILFRCNSVDLDRKESFIIGFLMGRGMKLLNGEQAMVKKLKLHKLSNGGKAWRRRKELRDKGS